MTLLASFAIDLLAHLRFLTIAQVCDLTTYTARHIYRLERSGKFPNRVRLGANRVTWRLAEIEQWFAARPVVKPATTEVEELNN